MSTAGGATSEGATSRGAAAWGVVVPVKLLPDAKTRLAPLGERARTELALAFAEDVVTALLACAAVTRVVVVTDDPRAAGALAGPHVLVVPDAPAAGQNAALQHGADVLRSHDPGTGVAALSSDLPSLRPQDLGDALSRVTARAFVPDASGLGTTLLAAAPGSDLLPAYGPGSRARHLASGAEELVGGASLRRDVDTPDDLEQALLLGVGSRTAAAVTHLR